MAKYIDTDDFVTDAAREFDFLISRGFVPGSSGDHRLLYASGDFAIEVLYDDRDGRVVTLVAAHVGDRNPRASLICLFVEAGLGPAQSVREICRTRKMLRPVLRSQAAALRDLLPKLTGPHAENLLLECNGR
jgi:hypothetical protein